MVFPDRSELQNEADVEQKFVLPLLTQPEDIGLGYSAADFKPKHDLRKFKIEKGKKHEKLYVPDYLVLIAGLPMIAIEAKSPQEDVYQALREARLYAHELNASYPHGINPCSRVIATNGHTTITAPVDTDTPDIMLEIEQCNPSVSEFDALQNVLRRSIVQVLADGIRTQLCTEQHYRAVDLVGGRSTLEENIENNSFGAEIAINFRHVFAPTERSDRKHIVRNAYVGSKRKRHYVDEIDRIIHTAITSSVPRAKQIRDTENPTEFLSTLRKGRSLENEVLLLVGATGSGKSTFVDYCREVQLPKDILNGTEWVHLDLNVGSAVRDYLERYLLETTTKCLRDNHPNTDFDEIASTVFAPEIRTVTKLLSNLDSASEAYQTRIADELIKLRSDALSHCKAMSRYLCGDKGKLLIVVFDNSDKGNRADQLRAFEAARWLQEQVRCLIVLPIRDTTYDTYKGCAPLDTMIKDLIFRIEPPSFTSILRKRLRLVTEELTASSKAKVLEFKFENKIPFQYPKSDLGYYLASLFRSLYEHDRMIRSLILGLAGKDVRKAMEIFLDFCRSGHVGTAQIQKIKMQQGRRALPYHVVSRVMLRGDRRFYDGERSHIKNLFQSDTNDPFPDPFVRVDILDWLRSKHRVQGPNGFRGYHQCQDLLAELVVRGHDKKRCVTELDYLISNGCVIIEHQEPKMESESDLVTVSPSGLQHLNLMRDVAYLAACAEEAWISDRSLVERISKRIGASSPREHFSIPTTISNATEFLDYLERTQTQHIDGAAAVERNYRGVDLDSEEVRRRAGDILASFLKREGCDSP